MEVLWGRKVGPAGASHVLDGFIDQKWDVEAVCIRIWACYEKTRDAAEEIRRRAQW